MRVVKLVLLGLMALFYVFGGINHFVDPDTYVAIMPPYLPWHLELVYLSGVAEIALGVAVTVPHLRRLAAWGIIALLVAIFPANIHIAVNNLPVFGATEGAGIWNWVRLPGQGLLIAWAWWYTREEPSS